jgi:hypothetical protein
VTERASDDEQAPRRSDPGGGPKLAQDGEEKNGRDGGRADADRDRLEQGVRLRRADSLQRLSGLGQPRQFPLSDPHRAKLTKPRVLIHPRAAPSRRFEVKHGPGVLF